MLKEKKQKFTKNYFFRDAKRNVDYTWRRETLEMINFCPHLFLAKDYRHCVKVDKLTNNNGRICFKDLEGTTRGIKSKNGLKRHTSYFCHF